MENCFFGFKYHFLTVVHLNDSQFYLWLKWNVLLVFKPLTLYGTDNIRFCIVLYYSPNSNEILVGNNTKDLLNIFNNKCIK